MIGTILTATAIAGVGGTGAGGLGGIFLPRGAKRTTAVLLAFAGGVMMSVVCFDLLTEALHTGAVIPFPVLFVIGVTLVGYVAIFLLDAGIGRRADRCVGDEDRDRLFLSGVIMASAIALHNLPEGIVIGACYAMDAGGATRNGFLMAVVIGLHNIPEGMAVAVPLAAGGARRGRVLLVTACSGAPTVLGALIGYLVGRLSPLSLTASLSFAGGAMLYVVLAELLPQANGLWRSKWPALSAFIGVLAGIFIIFG